VEPAQQIIWAFEVHAFGKLAIVLVAKAQGKVPVAAEGIQILAGCVCDLGASALVSDSEPQKHA
jgi:hypothetical protein